MNVLDVALDLARHGFRVVPLQPARKGDPKSGKRPTLDDWPSRASAEESYVRDVFGGHRGNVGIATGSGLLVLDVDTGDGKPGIASLEALTKSHGKLPRTVTAWTGSGGLHYYFRTAEAGLRNSASKLGPGLDIRAEGGQVVAPPSEHFTGARYRWAQGVAPGEAPIADAPAWLVDLLRPPVLAPVPRVQPKTRREGEASPYDRAQRYLATLEPSVQGQNGSGALWKAAQALVVGFELSEGEALALLREDFNPRCDPPWSERELEHKVRDASTKSSLPRGWLLHAERDDERRPARAAPPEPPPPTDADAPPPAAVDEAPAPQAAAEPLGPEDDDPRPLIRISTKEYEVNAEAIGHLANDSALFQRAGSLVHIVRDPAVVATRRRVKLARPPDAPRIAQLPAAVLREKLTRVARWEKYSKTEDDWTPAHPPDWTVAAIHSRGEWAGIRALDGIVETPVFRRDGSVLDRPGYDPATRLVFEPTETFLPVPERPSRHDANRAASELLEVICDFPFEGSEHAAAWVAGLLTPLARAAFNGPVPMFIADANAPASGKTLLMDVIAAIAQGREFSRTTNCPTDEEWKKQITSIALAGEPMVLIDNVTGGLGSASLDAALTGSTWSDRILGKNEKPNLRLTTVWYASANNVVLKGDLFRRCVHIRLKCLEENPQDRQDFRHVDLLSWVRRERPRLVRAALTILRAYHVAGRPDMKVGPWGSYEEWNRLIPHALVFAGFKDPTVSRRDFADTAATEVSSLRKLIEGLAAMRPGPEGMTVREILQRVESESSDDEFHRRPDRHAGLREALDDLAPPQPGRPYDAKRVGVILRKFRARVAGGCYLERGRNSRDGVARWTVVSTAHPAEAAA